MARRDDYDWLDDPFDERKAAARPSGMSGASKAAVGVGCAAVAAALALLALAAGAELLAVLAA